MQVDAVEEATASTEVTATGNVGNAGNNSHAKKDLD